MDKKMRLYYVMLACFMLWLGGISIFIWYVLQDSSRLDPALALTTGLGIGAVTAFFMLQLKDGWQYYFRKKGPTTEAANGDAGQ